MEKVVGKKTIEQDIIANFCDICNAEIKCFIVHKVMTINYTEYDFNYGEHELFEYHACDNCSHKILDLFNKK